MKCLIKLVFLNGPKKYFSCLKIHACGVSTHAKFIAIRRVEQSRKQWQKRSQGPITAKNQIQTINQGAVRRINVFNVDRKIPLELSKQRMTDVIAWICCYGCNDCCHALCSGMSDISESDDWLCLLVAIIACRVYICCAQPVKLITGNL